jgi:hypothetical protein
MIRRGKILRDTNSGPGLLVVDGTQLPFTLEGTWRSEMPPRAGMVVDVEVDRERVVGVSAVPESQLAREQAEVALAAARERGGAIAGAMVARFGAPTLAAAAALIVGWLCLSAASISTPIGSIDLTFWDVLAVVNSGGAMGLMQRLQGGGGGAGIYGVLAVAAIAGPFLHEVWKDRRAHLGALLPLALMLFIAWKTLGAGPAIEDAEAAGALGAQGAEFVEEMQRAAREEMRKAISIGLGAYLSAAAAIYFAVTGARRFLAASRAA